jgi:flagellar basal-body rod protein FlgB
MKSMVHELALNLRIHRQDLLASNIANADTPNYKAVDFDFRNALQKAMMEAENGGIMLEKTSMNHLSPDKNPLQTARSQYRIPQQPSLDGNTVEDGTEKMLFMDNAISYQFSEQMASDHYKDILKLFTEIK